MRLRLSDHNVDIMSEGVDVAFKLGILEDSNLRMRGIMNCQRVICASPDYLETTRHAGHPRRADRRTPRLPASALSGFQGIFLDAADAGRHREARSQRTLRFRRWRCADQWALEGRGIINKPLFEVKSHLNEGTLAKILEDTPPASVQLAAIYPHKRFQDPKVRLMIDFMTERCQRLVSAMLAVATQADCYVVALP